MAQQYWIKADGTIYSLSEGGVITPSTNAAFQNWSNAGHSPRPWPRDDNDAQTMDALLAETGRNYNLAKAGLPRDALLFGDSITARNSDILPAPTLQYNGYGYFTQTNMQMGNPFYLDPTLNKGVSGDTTTMMAARFQRDVLANLDAFDIAFIMAGTNDALGPALTTFQNIQYFVTTLLNAGKWVVLYAILPRTGGGRNPYCYHINTLLRQWVSRFNAKSPLFFVDCVRDFADPTTGDPATGTTTDGTHSTNAGAYLLGKRTAAVLSPYFPPHVQGLSSPLDTFSTVYNPYGNILPNSCFATVSGGTVTNATGVSAGSMILTKASGNYLAAAVAGSVTSGTAGYGARAGNTQVITCSLPSALTTNENVNFGYQGAYPAGIGAGTTLFATARIDLSNITGKLTGVYLVYVDYTSGWVYIGGAIANKALDSTFFAMNADNQTLWLMTPRWTLGATSYQYKLYLNIVFDAVAAPATATVGVSEMGVFPVTPGA